MEKTVGQDEYCLLPILSQTEYEAKYDAAAKKLLSNKIVLAHILQGCVEEYQDYSIDDIAEKYIEEQPEVSSIGVHKDESNQRKILSQIRGSATEDVLQTEGKITYDIRFAAIAPSRKAKREIRLLLNVEAQNRFYPGYHLIKRSVYYGCRMISSQYGSVFTGADYDKIEKVYSIWICTEVPAKFKDTITRYALQPEVLVGNQSEKQCYYDLMAVVMVCLGDEDAACSSGLLRFLKVLFSTEKSAEEKKEILHREFGIGEMQELEGAVEDMCNLSQGVLRKGMERGIERGREQGEDKFAELTRRLLETERTDDVIRATSDKEFRVRLYQEFQMD